MLFRSLGAGLAGAAQAASSVTYSDSIGLATTDWNQNVSVPKFDPALGTLDSITFKLIGHVEGNARFESLDASPAVITMDLKATLTLLRPDLSPILAVIPGPRIVDLKLLASFLSEKKVHLPTEREAEELTGLQAGGISPLALINKGFQVVIDSAAQKFDQIYISGGQRGLDIQLGVDDLVKLTNARMGNVSREE